MEQKIFHLHALTALHVGTGQSVGAVDLPIMRARANNLPIVPGSALKGVLRDDMPLPNAADRKAMFGPDTQNAGDHAGALAMGDANLLILPIRSFAGVVAFATCPYILARYARDRKLTGNNAALPTFGEGEVGVVQNSPLVVPGAAGIRQVFLEDLDLVAKAGEANTTRWAGVIGQSLHPGTDPTAIAWRTEFQNRFAILHDNVFSFLADTATEIRARVRIDDETRTVATGALWYEENLPAEAVLWGVAGMSGGRDGRGTTAGALAAMLPAEMALQVGGKHTVGRGLCRILFA